MVCQCTYQQTYQPTYQQTHQHTKTHTNNQINKQTNIPTDIPTNIPTSATRSCVVHTHNVKAGLAPSTELAHARTVLLVVLVHMPISPSLFWHSVMEVSLPSQSTAASATGRFSNSTCTARTMTPHSSWHGYRGDLARNSSQRPTAMGAPHAEGPNCTGTCVLRVGDEAQTGMTSIAWYQRGWMGFKEEDRRSLIVRTGLADLDKACVKRRAAPPS